MLEKVKNIKLEKRDVWVKHMSKTHPNISSHLMKYKHALITGTINTYLHICMQKPYGQIIVMTSVMCCLYSCTRHLFPGIIMRCKCCFFGGVSGLCCIGFLCISVSVMLDEEQADWTLLASAVPSCLKDNLYLYFEVFPYFVFFYSTLPNINRNFIPGSFMIFYDNGQIVFGLVFMSTPYM